MDNEEQAERPPLDDEDQESDNHPDHPWTTKNRIGQPARPRLGKEEQVRRPMNGSAMGKFDKA